MKALTRFSMVVLAVAVGAGVLVVAAEEEARHARAATTIGAPVGAPLVVQAETAPVEAARLERPMSKAVLSLAGLYPDQVQASEAEGDAASTYWALLIGINEYAGSTEDASGSRQDAKELRKIMLHRGWKKSHIMFVKDEDATAARIIKAFKWLASKTSSRSTVVFHYAGHEMPFYTDQDGDGEARDVAIWATDNRFVMDGKVGRLLDNVRAKKMWLHFATCRAGGFNDAGTRKHNRVITYSSPESELSYEDPSVGHSVMGWYTIVNGLRKADYNGDNRHTVEEAFRWARNKVEARTGDRQHPFIVDRLDGSFRIAVPKPKSPPPTKPEEPSQDCTLGVCLP